MRGVRGLGMCSAKEFMALLADGEMCEESAKNHVKACINNGKRFLLCWYFQPYIENEPENGVCYAVGE